MKREDTTQVNGKFNRKDRLTQKIAKQNQLKQSEWYIIFDANSYIASYNGPVEAKVLDNLDEFGWILCKQL